MIRFKRCAMCLYGAHKWQMKTTFSYFPGMFENPAPEKYVAKDNR